MNGVRSNLPASVLVALARRELQHEQRGVDHRILRHRRRSSDHDGNRQRAAQRLARMGHENIFEDTAHFLASRRQIRQDHPDVARPRQHLVARPLRGEIELGRRVVCCDDCDVGRFASGRHDVHDPLLRTPAFEQPRHRGRHCIEAGTRDAFRRHRFRLVGPESEARFVERVERDAATLELTAPRIQCLRLGRIECLQAVERDQIVMQAPPASCGKPCGIRGIEKIARGSAAGDDVIPENSRLRRRQDTRARSRRRPRCASVHVQLTQPRAPRQDVRCAPCAQALLLRVTRIAEPDGVREPPAGRQNGDVSFEESVEMHSTS